MRGIGLSAPKKRRQCLAKPSASLCCLSFRQHDLQLLGYVEAGLKKLSLDFG